MIPHPSPRRLATALAALLLGAELCAGQSDSLAQKAHRFSVSAQLWSRGEVRDGALPKEGEADYAMFLMSNNILRVDYSNPWLEVRVAPKYFGVWGSSSSGEMAIDEAWFNLKYKGFFAKMGRQKLYYDDQRIIGADDWVMTTASHDVLKTGFESKKHKLHLLLAFNQNDENLNGGTYYTNGAQPYKSMQTLWYHYDVFPWLGFSLIGMNTGMQSLAVKEDKSEYQQLFGGYLNLHPDKFSLEASYYRQCGHEEHGLPIHAWMTSAETSWQMMPKLGLQAGYFYLSGDSYYIPVEGGLGLARMTEARGFNPIFGSHHKFYGAMDFFYVTSFFSCFSPGLQDLHLGVNWDALPKLNLKGVYHFLATTATIEEANKALGHELEFSLAWKLAPDVSLQAGYSFMKGTETMKVLKRTSEDNVLRWGWLMIVVTPEFFKH